MIKAIVFDLDDTLISEREYIKSGFKVIAKEISDKYKLNKKEVFEKMEELFEKSSKNVFNRILENYEIEYEKNEILRLIGIYRNHEPKIKFFDDVIPTITELKKRGYKIGMITDGYKETQNKKLDTLKCRGLFDEIIVTDELGREFWKPHEKSYMILKEKFECSYEEMIYIGDNEEKDFITSNQLGIYTIKKEDGGIYINTIYPKEYKSKRIIKKIEELINIGDEK